MYHCTFFLSAFSNYVFGSVFIVTYFDFPDGLKKPDLLQCLTMSTMNRMQSITASLRNVVCCIRQHQPQPVTYSLGCKLLVKHTALNQNRPAIRIVDAADLQYVGSEESLICI